MTKTEKLDHSIYIRCTADDVARLDALADTIAMMATKSGLARAALRIGLQAIEADPAVLLGTPQPKRGGKRPGAGRRKPKP